MSTNEQLARAVLEGDVDEVERLLADGADAAMLDEHGYGLVFRFVNARHEDEGRMLRLLVEHGADVDRTSSFGESALRTASRNGDVGTIEALLALGADRSPLGWTPLHEAVALGDLAALEEALAEKERLRDVDSWSRAPWHLAIQLGDLAKADLLHAAGFDPNAPGHLGRSPLMYALAGDHLPMLKWLLEHGADPTAVDAFGDGLGAVAVESSAATCLAYLLERGWASLDLTAEATDDATIGVLLDAGGNIDAIDAEGYTLLMAAAEAGNEQRVRWLLVRGADPDATSTGEAALHKAIQGDALDIAAQLVEAGADVNQPDVDGDRPLAFARSEAAVDLLLAAGADPDLPASVGDDQIALLGRLGEAGLADYAHREAARTRRDRAGTALHAAACLRNVGLMEECLALGESAGVEDREGRTPLHWLASSERSRDTALRILRSHSAPTASESIAEDCIDLLLRHGATVDAADRSGSTALLEAMQWGRHDTARRLVERGAEVDVRDVTGWTPVLLAANTDDVDMLEFLLQHGGSLDDVRNGWSALHYATHHGRHVMVRDLLRRSVDPNRRHGEGRLALPVHSAAFMGHVAILRTLLEAGAHPSPLDGDGMSPRDHAGVRRQAAVETDALLGGLPASEGGETEGGDSVARYDEIIARLDAADRDRP